MQIDQELLSKIGFSAAFIFGCFVLEKIARKILSGLAQKKNLPQEIVSLLLKFFSYGIWTVCAITVLETLGFRVSAIITSLGLTGFALTFAMKDTLANLISGLFIILYRPFRAGDLITVKGFSGTVENIDFRYTKIKTSDGTTLLPNSLLLTNPIEIKQS